jgi:hypothetical protein
MSNPLVDADVIFASSLAMNLENRAKRLGCSNRSRLANSFSKRLILWLRTPCMFSPRAGSTPSHAQRSCWASVARSESGCRAWLGVPPDSRRQHRTSVGRWISCRTRLRGDGIPCLTVVDRFTRESPAIEVDTSLPGARVVLVLEAISGQRGLPHTILMDNGPELTSRVLDQWAMCTG